MDVASDIGYALLATGLLWLLAYLIPPQADNVANGAFLAATKSQFVQACAVRPDTLIDGPTTDYVTYSARPTSLFDARVSTRANVAAFMADLIESPALWARWRGRFPVVLNKVQPPGSPPTPEPENSATSV